MGETRYETFTTFALEEDLAITHGNGLLTIPAGSPVSVVAVIEEPEITDRLLVVEPDTVVEYRVNIVADGLTLTQRGPR